MDNLSNKDPSINVFSGVKALFYLIVAIFAMIPTYAIYKLIAPLFPTASTSITVTSTVIFWLISYFVIYHVTIGVYKGDFDVRGRRL